MDRTHLFRFPLPLSDGSLVCTGIQEGKFLQPQRVQPLVGNRESRSVSKGYPEL